MRHAPISRIYQMGEPPDPTPAQAEDRTHEVRAEIWHRFGAVVLDPEDHGDFDRLYLIGLAEKKYGRRPGKRD